MWTEVKDGHPVARAIFGRHYTYNRKREQISLFWQRNRNYSLIAGPGEKLLLVTEDQKALFVWRKFIDKCIPPQTGVNCAAFRNESGMRASDLIRAADKIAWQRWPGERLYTYVDAEKVRAKRDPGHCFILAGYRPCGTTKGGLLIFEKLPVHLNPFSARNPIAPAPSHAHHGTLARDGSLAAGEITFAAVEPVEQ